MIRIVAAVVLDGSGRVLLVRKRGTDAFMQPGGKRELGAADLESLVRELREELGCRLLARTAQALGTFEAPGANEAGQRVRAALYRVAVEGEVAPRAEIEEATWIDPRAPSDVPLAPLTRDHVLPLAAELSPRDPDRIASGRVA